MPRSLDSPLGFLLEHVQHIDVVRKADGVDGAVRVPVMILYDFKDPGTFEAFQRFRRFVLSTQLGSSQCDADRALHGSRKGAQVLEGGRNPVKGLRRRFIDHAETCQI